MNKYLLPTILIFLSIGLFVMYTNPTYQKVKILRQKQSQYNEALNKSKEIRTVRDRLLSQYNAFSRNDLAKLKKMVPDTVDNVRLIMDINDIASKYGTIITNVKVVDPNANSGKLKLVSHKKYGSVALQFSMLTTYENFVNFLSDIKNNLRLVDVSKIEFDLPKDNPNIYKFKLDIKTYWLK